MLRLPLVMGHRGAAALAPENTLAGIRRAAASGARWVEVDVMLTADDVPVLFHDDKLDRTTGLSGLMARTPYEAVGRLDAGSWFDRRFSAERIPSLAAACELLLELRLSANIEIKPSKGREIETAQATLAELSRCWPAAAPAPLISSFHTECLEIARRLKPAWPRAFITLRVPRNWRALLANLECASFHVYWKRLSEKQARRIKAAGYALACFTVNDPALALRLRRWGVDCMISDDPGAVLAALSAPAPTPAR